MPDGLSPIHANNAAVLHFACCMMCCLVLCASGCHTTKKHIACCIMTLIVGPQRSHLNTRLRSMSGLVQCVVATLCKSALPYVTMAFLLAGTMAPAARALRAALKEAAGKLMAQLYDRNSRRQFLPAEAFQTDSLPPERFRVEMQTAAAASGGLMQATNTRVWGLLRCAHLPPSMPASTAAL